MREYLREILPFLEEQYRVKINGLFEELIMELARSKANEVDLKLQLEEIKKMAQLREILSNFKSRCPHVNHELMELAHDMFPKEFPQEYLSKTFTRMIKILVDRKATLKDKELLDIDNKLDLLLKVATAFRWAKVHKCWTGADFGNQFFVLCKNCAEWNIAIFHPKIIGNSRIKIMQDASKGLYIVDGFDLGSVVKELLHV